MIDPSLNPDGNDRFVNWANENRGRFASPAAIAREHNQPWPGGRTNYYWFDLNRDWLPLTSAAVWVENSGAGRVIAIADDPVFRGYVRSSERFLTNALYLGPTISVPSAPKSEEAVD